jgi:anti-repressor protein
MKDLMIQKSMTSMEIAKIVGKRHSDIMRDIRDESRKLENGFICHQRKFALVDYKDTKGEVRPCYNLTKEGVLQLAARYDAVVRSKLIERAFQEKEQPKHQIPQTYAQALLEAGRQAERAEIAELKLEIAKPKVEYYDEVLNSSRLSSFTEVAKDIGMTAQQLSKFLQEEKIIFKKNNVYHLYRNYTSLLPKYFDYHITKFGQNLKITEQGRKFIIDKLNFGG